MVFGECYQMDFQREKRIEGQIAKTKQEESS